MVTSRTDRKGDHLNAIRRRAEQRLDQAWAVLAKKLTGAGQTPPCNGDPRFALITVNFSTTRYLKLMLLTLCEQRALDNVHRIIIVDNGSRDGGLEFLGDLTRAMKRIHLVKNRFFRNHARGLRLGLACLDAIEREQGNNDKCNLLLICDPDVIFLNPDTLSDLANALETNNAALAGELRHNLYPEPEAQASFLAIRRDSYVRKDVLPFVHHGAPAYWMQRSLHRSGQKLADFPSNRGGYILHRGRSGVAAAAQMHPRSAYATARNNAPHYMGIPEGQRIWQATEQKYSDWLNPENEPSLINYLAGKLAPTSNKGVRAASAATAK